MNFKVLTKFGVEIHTDSPQAAIDLAKLIARSDNKSDVSVLASSNDEEARSVYALFLERLLVEALTDEALDKGANDAVAASAPHARGE